MPSASVTRAQLQVSARPTPAPKPRSFSSRLVPSAGKVAASRETAAAAGWPGSKARRASADGVAAPKIAAPVGLAKITRAASTDQAQAGSGLKASGARRGSRSQTRQPALLIGSAPAGIHAF